jgi:hypothetical protein
VLILHDFKSFAPEVLILGDFKSLFPEVLILVDFKSGPMREIQKVAKISEVLILEELWCVKCKNGRIWAGELRREGCGMDGRIRHGPVLEECRPALIHR